jgi:hypothetical protein
MRFECPSARTDYAVNESLREAPSGRPVGSKIIIKSVAFCGAIAIFYDEGANQRRFDESY